jgi:hypothetical protein
MGMWGNPHDRHKSVVQRLVFLDVHAMRKAYQIKMVGLLYAEIANIAC